MPLDAAEAEAARYDKPFVISRELPARREVVWRAFTDPLEMQQWWGPKGATIIASKMDLRPAGTYLYGMRTPDGKEMWGRMVYREIAPPERLVFVNSFSDPLGGLTRHPLAPDWPLQLLTHFTFDDLGDRTRFNVRWAPISPTTAERAAFDGGHASMTGGWSGTMEQLTHYLAKK